ncbi:hypothetical protein [Flindersiella endophytica]
MDDRTRPTGADDTGELSRQHRGRRKARPHRRRALHVAVLVPLAIASASWAAVSFNTPIREATHSWFPDGYKVAVAPAKETPTDAPETTSTEDDSETAGKQNSDDTKETTEARNRVPVTADPTQPSDDNGGSRSDDTDDPSPQQPEPTHSKVPAPTTEPTTPPSDDPEPQPTVTERPTSQPTEDPGPSDDGDDDEDGGIIDIDIDLPLPLPLVAAPGPEASKTGTNSLVETGIPGAVPGTGKHTSVNVNVADLATWTFFVWQSLS